jgi:hypothetical protein
MKDKRVETEQGVTGMSTGTEISVLNGNPTPVQKVKDERAVKVLWWILMSMRFVIPGYILYVVYLYWTTPISDSLQRPF